MKGYVTVEQAMEMEVLGFIAGYLFYAGTKPTTEIGKLVIEYFKDRPHYIPAIDSAMGKMAKLETTADPDDTSGKRISDE